MARFFIDRPVFAWVIALMIMLAGVLCITQLPVSQYPEVAPPAVRVSTSYPGASAQTMENTVTQVIEQQMTGLDGMRYMSATSSADGSMSLEITFEQGTDPDIAQVQVQNKVQQALPLLPNEVQQQGVRVTKSTSNFLMMIGLYSEDGSMGDQDIADYVGSNIQDPIGRIPGVGETMFFGGQYSMRIWLNPDALINYEVSISEVTAAITAQNAQVSVGELGGTPAVEGQRLTATIVGQSRLTTVEEFENILVKVSESGAQVKLKDIARVELGSRSYNFESRYNGMPSSGLGVRLASGANALEVSTLVHAEMEELAKYFPHGLKVVYPMDTAPFVRISIEGVIHTLVEAIVLVFLVMFLFLQNVRATLIPTIAVPVVLLGTFAVMAALGFSINTLTMFGLVLAIGLLVDDAIVVVENVERVMEEEDLSPLEATRKSMDQITGALVGIAMVLAAVFLPMAFFAGSTGVIYRQFSVTIASAMLLSVVVAIVLTPTLCVGLLKRPQKGDHKKKRGFFGLFNYAFEKTSNAYGNGVAGVVKHPWSSMFVYVGIIAIMGFLFIRIPSAFLPNEDQGFMFVQATLPAGSTQEQTMAVIKEIERYFLEEEKEAVSDVFLISGFSFGGRGQNVITGFINMRDWSLRQDDNLKVPAVAQRASAYFSNIKVALAYAFAPPAITELGTADGFELRIQDRAGLGHAALMEARDQLISMSRQNPNVAQVRVSGLDDTPQYNIKIDNEKAGALGLSIADINNTLSVAWGSAYIDDFINRGRVKNVYIQADAPYRMTPEDMNFWYVKNNKGEMVPFSSFASGFWAYGSPSLDRFNGFSSVTIQGQAAPGKSSGEAMDEMEAMMEKLPSGLGLEWSSISYEEKLAGSQTGALYAISLIVIFLCLAALYESWSIPVAVLMVVPLGVLGAVLAVWMRGITNDVYFQVGLLTTVGLSSKNAILIVEFAKDGMASGLGLVEATLHAARLRFRPILMTSLAFGFGVLPLAISSGASSGAQNAIGTSVLGGVCTGTLLTIFLVPLFFILVTKLFSFGKNRKKKNPQEVFFEEQAREGGNV